MIARFPPVRIHAFSISNTFISNTRLNLAKNQAKAKQHPEAELLLSEYYPLSSSTLSSKNNRRYSKICVKTSTSVSIRLLIMMKMKLKMKNRLHRYAIKKPRPIRTQIYQIYSTIIICIKQHLSNF